LINRGRDVLCYQAARGSRKLVVFGPEKSRALSFAGLQGFRIQVGRIQVVSSSRDVEQVLILLLFAQTSINPFICFV